MSTFTEQKNIYSDSEEESDFELDTCNICCYNMVDKPIVCPKPSCGFSCCRTCVKKYLLGKENINPMCMSCNSEWDFCFLANNTEHNFHNKIYRDHRARILMEQEKAMLPTTQHLAKTYRDIDECRKYISILRDIKKKFKKKNNRMIINRKIYEKQAEIWELKHEHSSSNKSKKPTVFLGHCPEDDCKGYINVEFVCGICGTEVCKKCRNIVHKNKCNKDDIASVKFLTQDTKPCPTCHIPIHKISGCSQMWCPSCHTTFSWNTGEIERGRIHNPHYYEWIRKNNGGNIRREPGDVRCGGEVSYNRVLDKLKNAQINESDILWVEQAYILVGHMRDEILLQYRNIEPNETTHQDLRVRYLAGKLTEKNWQKELKKREKKREKIIAVRLVLDMACNSIDSLLGNIIEADATEVPMILIQLSNLQEYINKSLGNIKDRLKNKVPVIEKDWSFTHVKETRINRDIWRQV